jgi:hypothetical protein
MRDELFHIEQGDNGYWWLAPMRAETNGKYLIRAMSRQEAEELKHRILSASSPLPTPLEDEAYYRKVGQSGDTPIFEHSAK